MKKVLVLALCGVVGSAFAQTAFWSGDTTGGPTMARPLSYTGTSGSGTAVHYQVQPFWVTVGGTYTFEINGVSHPDTYALAYSSFNPATPLVGLLDGDDDFSGSFTLLSGTGQGFASSRIGVGETTNFSGGTGLGLSANTQYYAVVAGFGNNDFGTYDAAIGGGQGRVVLGAVPEPATMLALIAGVAGLASRRRRK
ncbi:MAG: PEP-CTERM sorting domain-containing protein [Fimbriimonadaceae bacterium]|nr:PEP-CTERM sorting domain-containing protein [Fimbriimonadaceae bacterium]